MGLSETNQYDSEARVLTEIRGIRVIRAEHLSLMISGFSLSLKRLFHDSTRQNGPLGLKLF